MTHGAVAKKVRQHKEANPHLYCPRCLWRTGGGHCPRHAPYTPVTTCPKCLGPAVSNGTALKCARDCDGQPISP